MDKALETITGVAMLTFDGEMWALPKPARHGNLFALAAFVNNHATGETQGFMTSTGRFVERKEARLIATAAGQLLPRAMVGHEILYSEDVW